MKQKIDKYLFGAMIFMAALNVFQAVVIGALHDAIKDSQNMVLLWRHKTDSLYDESFRLHEDLLELKYSNKTDTVVRYIYVKEKEL